MISGKYMAPLSLLGVTLLTYEVTERRLPDFLAAPLDSLPANLDGWKATGEPPLSPAV